MSAVEEHVVVTQDGPVRGALAAGGVVAFRAIPYAAAPRGAGRFAAPRPPRRWRRVRAATHFGPIPAQPVTPMPGNPVWTPEDGGNPLTVNVWVPAEPGPPRPVLFWIYGGAYRVGYANVFLPYQLVRAGLVVVTFNYRVGFHGFGQLPGAPANRGLLDQLAALRWTRQNIGAFGGDPGQITAGGQSAGAGSAASLLVMPDAAGLARRAILHSVPSEYFTVELAGAIGREVAAAAGAAPTLEGFAGLSDAAIVAASEAVHRRFLAEARNGTRRYFPTIYNPVIDGTILPAAPLPAVAAGAARQVPLLATHTLDEFSMFTVHGMAPEVATESQLAAMAAGFGLPPGRLAEYRRTAAPDTPVATLHQMLGTDYLFGEYTSRLAEAQARAGGEAYLARFGWQSPVADGVLGACHGSDLPFAFGDPADGPVAGRMLNRPPNRAELALAGRMMGSWVAFASGAGPGWPPVTRTQTPVRIWDLTDRLVTEPPSPRRAAWADVSFDPLRR